MSGIRWVRVLVGGLAAELLVFAIVFPVLYLFGQGAFLTSILICSAVLPFIAALWVNRRATSHFVLHGALIGIVAALFYVLVAWGQPEPLLYKVAHGLKVVGGLAGGLMASRRRSTDASRPAR